jgi:hypothetical protein
MVAIPMKVALGSLSYTAPLNIQVMMLPSWTNSSNELDKCLDYIYYLCITKVNGVISSGLSKASYSSKPLYAYALLLALGP